MSRRRRPVTQGDPALRMLEEKADRAYARVMESIAAQTARDMEDEVKGWQLLTSAAGTDDLSYADLVDVRRRCVALWQIDPAIGQAAMLLQSGTFGRGISKPTAVDRRVQVAVERFWEDPDVQLHLTGRGAQILAHLALFLKGEIFFTVHVSPVDALVKIGEIDQGEVAAVITHPEDARKPILYQRKFRQTRYDFGRGQYVPEAAETTWYYRDWRYMAEANGGLTPGPSPSRYGRSGEGSTADEAAEAAFAAAPGLQEDVYVYHLKVNTIGLRGIPEVYRAYDWAKAHSRALSDLATWIKAASMFAWRIKMQTRSQTAVEKTARMFREPVPGAAAVHVGSDKLDLNAVDQPRGSDQMVQGADQLHLQTIRPFGFGAHWYSDVDQGTLATADNMDMPSIWRIEDRQETFRELYSDLCQVAIARARAQGDPPMPKSVDTYIDIEFPPAQPQQVERAAQAIVGLAALIDPREAARQAYQALGSNDIDQLLEEQFPEQEKLEGEQAKTEGNGGAENGGEADGGDGSQEPGEEGQVAEAVGDGVIRGPFSIRPRVGRL